MKYLVILFALLFIFSCGNDTVVNNGGGNPTADFDIYLVKKDIQNNLISTYTIKSDGSDLKLFNDSMGVSTFTYRNKILLTKANNIYTASYDGSNMTNIPLGIYQIGYCNLSPDAEKLYFVNSPGRSLFVVNTNGTGLVQISDIQYSEYGTAKFSPNGKLIAYFESSSANHLAVKLIISNSTGTYKKVIKDSINARSGVWLDWAPDGNRIIYQDYSIDQQEMKMCVIDTSKNNYTVLAEGLFPSWSPRGYKICFVNYLGYNRELYLMNEDGTNIINITNSTTRDEINIKWSKDGTNILYNSYEPGQPSNIWMYNLNTNTSMHLVDSVYDAIWK